MGRVLEGVLMPLADDLGALAALAGNSVVVAAATDPWESVRHGVARLFGRSGPGQAELARRRLDETRSQLAALSGVQLEQARAVLAQRWAGRLADLLEEDPGAEAELRALVGQVQAQLVSATGHSAAAGRDLTIKASGGGVAAGVMHASAIAGMGGTAIGQVVQQRQELAGLPVSLGVRPVLLAGREELLAGLDTQLRGSPAGPRVVALCGLGGAGKTTVAVEYAHRHLAEVGLAWQFPAEDPALLLAEFARLAAQLGAREVVDARDPVASVHAVLAAFPAEWLLVFDNAPGQHALQRFLPPAGNGRVLITSQSAAWPRDWAVQVPMLGTEVAAGFLVDRSGDPDERAAEDLAVELGGLPLALEQAAAYLQATGTTLIRYLSIFRDRQADLLARGEAGGHAADVAATLGLALSRLTEESLSAVGLLRLLACLAPEPVPLALLLADAHAAGGLAPEVAATVGPLLGDWVAAGDAIAALRCYSLVTPAADGLVQVHRLVQYITRARVWTHTPGYWEKAAAALVEAAIPTDPELPAAWPVCALLLPHARVVLDLTGDGMWTIALSIGCSGGYLTARDLFQLIADALREDDAYGAEHPRTLAARAIVSRWTALAGDPAQARDQLTTLLPIQERVLGTEHPHTLNTRSKLASSTGTGGYPPEARDQLAALLPIQERVLGTEHLDTLDTRGALAYWTGRAGDAAGARDQLAALLPIQERVLGTEHPLTLDIRGNLAYYTGQAGDPARGRDQLAALLPLYERVLGPEHPHTLAVRASIADYTGQAGDPAGARDEFAALLPIYQRVLGPEYPDIPSIRHNLDSWTREADESPASGVD